VGTLAGSQGPAQAPAPRVDPESGPVPKIPGGYDLGDESEA